MANPINIFAYHRDFGRLCDSASLDSNQGLSYPDGTLQGQAGWDRAVKFSSPTDLNVKLDKMNIPRGGIGRLAIMAHGKTGGKVDIFGRDFEEQGNLNPDTVEEIRYSLQRIGRYTQDTGSLILFFGCVAGKGERGTQLLVKLSQLWPGRSVVGFTTLGDRHPGEMGRKGGSDCELQGMRDTDAFGDDFGSNMSQSELDNLWNDLAKMPWASETSPHAKVALNGWVYRWPVDEQHPWVVAAFVRYHDFVKRTQRALPSWLKKP